MRFGSDLPFNSLDWTSSLQSKWVASQHNYLIHTCCLGLQCYHSYHQIKCLRKTEPLSLSTCGNSALLTDYEPSFFFILRLFQLVLCCFFIFLFCIWKKKFHSYVEYIEIYSILYWNKTIGFSLVHCPYFVLNSDMETIQRRQIWVDLGIYLLLINCLLFYRVIKCQAVF